jgi:hypothetical protein
VDDLLKALQQAWGVDPKTVPSTVLELQQANEQLAERVKQLETANLDLTARLAKLEKKRKR